MNYKRTIETSPAQQDALSSTIALPSKETDRLPKKRLPKFAMAGITSLNSSKETAKILIHDYMKNEWKTTETNTESALDSKKIVSTKRITDLKASILEKSVEGNSSLDNFGTVQMLLASSITKVKGIADKDKKGLIDSTLARNEGLPSRALRVEVEQFETEVRIQEM